LNKPLYDPNTQRIESQSPRREGVKENLREGQSFARSAYLEANNPYEKAKGFFSHLPKTGFNKKKQKTKIYITKKQIFLSEMIFQNPLRITKNVR